jgi:hypothetical protein
MKQTAVEWLVEQLMPKVLTAEQYYHIEKAKVMEKEHICNAYKEGNHSEMRGGKFINPIAEQYYNETFKSE